MQRSIHSQQVIRLNNSLHSFQKLKSKKVISWGRISELNWGNKAKNRMNITNVMQSTEQDSMQLYAMFSLSGFVLIPDYTDS